MREKSYQRQITKNLTFFILKCESGKATKNKIKRRLAKNDTN